MQQSKSEETSHPGLMKRLRGLTAHPPPERLRAEIDRLVQDLADEAADEAGLCEAALFLAARAATTPDEGIKDFYLSLLPRLGPLAAALCVIARLPEDDAATEPLLPRVPGELRLEAVNLLLQSRMPRLEGARSEALGTLQELGALPADEVRAFLAACAGRGLAVAHALGEAFMAGPYGQELDAEIARAVKDIQAGQRPPKGLTARIDAHLPLAGPGLEARLLQLLATKQASVLAASLRLLRRCGQGPSPAVAKAAAKIVAHPDRAVALEALATFMARSPKDQGRLCAALFKKDDVLRRAVLARAPLLSGAEHSAFTACLGGKDKNLAGELFAALAELDPEGALSHLEAAMAESGGADAAELLSLLPEAAPPAWADADAAQAAFKPRQEKKPEASKKKKKDREGGFFSMFGGGSSGEAISVQFGDSTVADMGGGESSENSGRKLSPIYDSRTLQRIDFSDSFLDNAVFQRCTLVGVSFRGTLIRGARFIECVFVDCDLTGARFHETTALDVAMRNCVLRDAVLADTRVTLFDAQQCDLRNCGLHGCRLRTCRFTACDMSGMQVLDCDGQGVEFLLSHCLGATFSRSRLLCHSVEASSFSKTAFCGLFTDSPGLMRGEDACLAARTEEYAARGPVTPELGHGARALAAETVGRWFRARDLRAQTLAFLRANQRRIDWCRDKLGPDKGGFFRLAPYLLHSEVFEQHVEGMIPLPLPMRMAGFAVDYTTLEYARRFFPKAAPPPPVPDAIDIQALYTIGSVGTVAQGPGSDLDYWVCYDPEDMPETLLDGLTDKLERIEHWADATLGLEVHFFTMDLVSIRENNFGFSDSESSGSAQALLLKEEFYRSVVCAAGKAPLWWATPVGASDGEYARIREDLAAGPAADRFVDLGNLVQIPPGEFFGASLWQIVKALKSPFKSIMKFGLLEKYIAAGDEGGSMLLCDKLKDNLARGHTSLLATDPYVLMFLEVGGHHKATKEKDSLNLVRLSFLLKTKIAEAVARGGPALRPEESELRALAGDPGMFPPGTLTALDGSFDKLAKIGALVNKFIVRTYMRVRDVQAERKDSIAITPEDLTKLGRKIFATFSKRKHKIEHIPFLSIGGTSFRILHFAASGKKMGQPSHWEVQGAQEVAGKERLELANLRSGPDLAESLAWLVANGIYHKNMQVRGDYSISPVTAKDIQNLLGRLLDFFPPKTTFNTDIAEMLNPERIVRAFFVLNLIQPREQNAVREVSIVYSTNWGELFCVTAPVKRAGQLDNLAEFLLQTVEQEFDTPPAMELFSPERASFPLPSL
ncbi:class I adenylate cyclase [Desulfocurvus sp. DL9XJH121]